MKVNLLYVGLLAGGVTALPQAPTPAASAPSTTDDLLQPENGSIEDSDASETPIPKECELYFRNREEGTDTWDKSGAADYLSDYLDDNGVEGWANDFLRDTVRGESPRGDTFDCSNIEDTSSCKLPEERPCSSYDPPEAYFIHISLGNLNSLFHTIYISLLDQNLDDLVSKAGEIEEIYGNPETEGLFPMLIGTFVMGAAASGPFWTIGAPLTAMVGVLNVAAGLSESQDDVTDTLTKTIENTYKKVRDQMKTTAEAITNGDFDDVDDVDDTTDFILDAFGDGQMLVVDEKNLALEDYKDNFSKLLNALVIFTCLSSNDWYLQIYDEDVKEDDCDDKTDGTGYWLDTPNDGGERCVAVGYVDEQTGNPRNPNDRTHFAFFDDDQWESFKTYGVDLEGAMKNILECDGGDPDFSDAGDIRWGGVYPPCLLPMKIEGVPAAPQDLDESTQSCTAEDKGVYLFYSMEISADYDSDACDDVYEAIKDHGSGVYKAPTNWQCEDQDGQFQLWFDYAKQPGVGSGSILNEAFGEVFPPEDGKYGNVNGFNCPDK